MRIICADWGKNREKRAAYESLPADRVLRRITEDVRDVAALLAYADRTGAPTLVAFDAPLGVPASYLAAVRKQKGFSGAAGFMDWLSLASLEDAKAPAAWTVEAPFFQVPAGKGSLRGVQAAALVWGVDLRRKIDVQTNGKSVFITAGVPGTVGSAARDIWRGLSKARADGRHFRAWPFEGSPDVLFDASRTTVAEIYPRAAYATALVDAAPRARMSLPKTSLAARTRAIDRLLRARWARAHGVRLEGLDEARANEDDFDAMISAAALLRCQLEGLPFWASPLHAPSVEGGILGTGSVDLALPETRF